MTPDEREALTWEPKTHHFYGEEKLNLLLSKAIGVLGGYMEKDSSGFMPGTGYPLAEYVWHEVRAALMADGDEWSLNFKRTALRAYEETPYFKRLDRISRVT